MFASDLFFPAHRGRQLSGRAWYHRRLLPVLFLSCAPLLVCSACGDPSDLSQDAAPADPVQVELTEESHPDGWGLSECLVCHPVFQIHQRASDPNTDLGEIRAVVDELGQSSCAFCHGANGT